jgi:hypothetical protein
VAEQAGQFDQLAGIGAQVAQRKGVAQRVRRNRHAREPGAVGEAGDHGLDAAHRHRGLPAAGKERRRPGRPHTMLEVLPEGAPRGGVQRHLARFESFALADANAAGAVAHADIGDGQGCDLPHAQPGLQHDLRQPVVSRRQAVG